MKTPKLKPKSIRAWAVFKSCCDKENHIDFKHLLWIFQSEQEAESDVRNSNGHRHFIEVEITPIHKARRK